MRACLTYLIIFSFNFSIISQTTIEKTIYFETDNHLVDNSEQAKVKDLQRQISNLSEYSIRIIGHTDQDGDDQYNIDLSRKRASEVENLLVSYGTHPSKISTSNLGEQSLISADIDEQSKRKNRRVEIIVEGYNYQSASELLSYFGEDGMQTKTINSGERIKLHFQKGTEVSIPENAFCYEDGSPIGNGPIQLNVIEAYSLVDFIDNRLFTQTADQLLETGGMIHIEAMKDGKKLKINDGKEIEIKLQPQVLVGDMELFTGVEINGDIIWEETGTEITTEKEKDKEEKEEDVFIKVDLDRLINFPFKEVKIPSLILPEMMAYPKSKRKPYPPYKGNYTDEKYEEVYQKYLLALDEYKIYKAERPDKLLEWTKEAQARHNLLLNHKKAIYARQVQNKLIVAGKELERKQNLISHDKLVYGVYKFLEKDLGDIVYDNLDSQRKLFGKSLKYVIAEKDAYRIPNYNNASAFIHCDTFYQALSAVNYDINYIKEEPKRLRAKSIYEQKQLEIKQKYES